MLNIQGCFFFFMSYVQKFVYELWGEWLTDYHALIYPGFQVTWPHLPQIQVNLNTHTQTHTCELLWPHVTPGICVYSVCRLNHNFITVSVMCMQNRYYKFFEPTCAYHPDSKPGWGPPWIWVGKPILPIPSPQWDLNGIGMVLAMEQGGKKWKEQGARG